MKELDGMILEHSLQLNVNHNQSESPILAVNYILTTKSQLKSFIQPAPDWENNEDIYFR